MFKVSLIVVYIAYFVPIFLPLVKLIIEFVVLSKGFAEKLYRL